jgi:hypothetical protein
MSRYGPGVLPVPRTTLAEALAGGVDAFMAMRTQRRREGFENAQETRAQAGNARADAMVGIQQGDARIRQQRAGWEAEDRPLQQAVSLAGAYNVGVERTRPEDGMPDVPYDGIAVPGTNYFLRPDATARGQAEQQRTQNAQLTRERIAAGLESWLLRGNTARDVARIRGMATVQAAGVRGATAGASNRDANLRAMTANDRALLQALDNDIESVQDELLLDDQNDEARARLGTLMQQRTAILNNFETGQQQLAGTVGAPRQSRAVAPPAATGGGARFDGSDPRIQARNAAVRALNAARDRALAAKENPTQVQREYDANLAAINKQYGTGRR